ncbi:MFS multidrug transporter, putative [Paecilomyces variotii No. 5]|uniref:MFS multidrug transporter, putative n=1 Tax=Byssochlamys spectabilis (strain No. 5 / NBRC 109023) TaxID=1356009 RepID=V5F9C2_BYSSN|nr:MFS multidrug transporter, putative [Paecilomyces variotii No. 5]
MLKSPEEPGTMSRSHNASIQPDVPDDGNSTLTGIRLYALFAAVFFSTFLMALNGSIISTAIPQITSYFKSLDDIGWYGSAYLVSTCCLQPLAGKFYTHFPIKQTYITFSAVFFIGSVICGSANSSKMLIGGRAVQGIGGAGLLNGAFTTIAAAGPKDRKPTLVGVGMGISTLGSVVGPLIGGAFTQHVSWRWCFYINLPPGGLAVLIISTLSIPEQMEKKPAWVNIKTIITEELDLVGFTLFAPACVMFLLAIIWGGATYPWRSSTIIGLFCGAFGTLIVFIAWIIHKGEKAMIPPNIARKHLVMFGCFTSCFQMGAVLLLSYYLPIWFQVVKNATPTMSGVMILPTAVAQILGAISAGKFVELIGYCTAWALVGCMLSSIGAGLMTTFLPSTGAGPWIGYQILMGIGRGSVIQMPITAIQNLLPAQDVAIASSLVFFFQYLGGAIFLAVGETLFTNGLRSSLRAYAPKIHPQTIINAGASAVRKVVPEADLPSVLLAYDRALVHTFYLALAGSTASFLTSFGMGWKRIPRKAAKKKDEKAVA